MKNKTVLITGSSSGIGKQIGFDMLRKGYHVIFNCRTEEYRPQLLEELQDYHSYGFTVADFSYRDWEYNYFSGVDILIEQLKDIKIDYLVMNTGTTDRTPFKKISMFNWEKVMHENLNVNVYLIQQLYDKINSGGSLLFIGSILGKIADGSSISYGVSKGAIPILTKYLAKEFAPNIITVNNLECGFIYTKWHGSKDEEQMKRIANKTLVGRFGTVDEVSQMAISILENTYLTGTTVELDGGYCASV